MHPEALREQSKTIFFHLKQFPEFYLASGTALALQIGHRISVDFDLFSERDIERALLAKVKRAYPGLSINVSVNNPDELTAFIDKIKLTFLYYPFPTIFDPILYEGVKLLPIKEIAATKAYTIGRRGSYKDYIDLYFILAEAYASLEEIVEIAEKKYNGEFNSRLFFEQLVYLSDIEDTEIEFLRGGSMDETTLEKFFSDKIKMFPI